MFRMPRVVDASDRAFLVLFDDGSTPAAGLAVRTLHDWLRRERPAAVVDLHPAYQTLLVTYDPLLGDPVDLAAEIGRRAGSLSAWRAPASRSFVVPVRYGGADGPDLEDVARLTGLSAEAVIAAHSGASYEVRFIGFSPGFPYLGGLPERLRTPRRDTPRTSVPAGSVAIAGGQAGIYSVRSPGGWNVIGMTDFVLFQPADEAGATLSPGDRVRFEPLR
jgi:KipI family sensor histidine kinase inhibitor